MKYLIICNVIFIVVIWALEENCELNKYCYNNGKHIGCEQFGEISNDCINKAHLIDITDDTKQLIVHTHNVKRNLVAGRGAKLEAACRMATMEWDDELALYASMNVQQCRFMPKYCHNTEKFRNTEQNLALIHPYIRKDFEQKIEKAIQQWYDRVSEVKQEYIDRLPEDKDIFYKIRHLTALVTDRNIRVGCAASYFIINEKFDQFLFVCNYAAGNKAKFAVYEKCDHPAKKCLTGKNPNYPNLCSVKEEFDYNYDSN